MPNPMPGDDRPTNESQPLLLDLLAAFLGLSDDTENAGRLMLLGPTGQFVGDASLSVRDMRIAIQALTAARALTEATRGMDLPGEAQACEAIPTGEWSAAAVAQNDTDLWDQVNDAFADIDPLKVSDDVMTDRTASPLTVTRALDEVFGDMPDSYADEDEA